MRRIKVMVDVSRIKNKKVKGCIICQNPKISKITDPAIFNAECDLKTLKERLQSDGFFVDVGVLANHAKHVFYDDNKEIVEKPVDTSLEMLSIENSSNLDIVKEGLANLLKAEKKLMDQGKEGTKEFLEVIVEKRRMIELKAKLEGELQDDDSKTIIIPPYIQRME
jgi:hypothetical protein